MNGDQSSRRDFQLRSWSHRQTILVRVGVGIWLLLLSAILYGAGVGGPWEWLLVGIAVLHFGLAYRLLDPLRHSPPR